MTSTSRVGDMLATIQRVEVPPRLGSELLRRLGFTSSNDRPFIRILKELRFLDDSGVPTQRYRDFRDPNNGGAVLAEAMREAYADVFFQEPEAQKLPAADLAAIFQRESGKSERVAQQMAATFKALAGEADWTGGASAPSVQTSSPAPSPEQRAPAEAQSREHLEKSPPSAFSLRHDVHVHLPSTTDSAVYDAIFKSLREYLL